MRPRDWQNLLLKLADLMKRVAQTLDELECLHSVNKLLIHELVLMRFVIWQAEQSTLI